MAQTPMVLIPAASPRLPGPTPMPDGELPVISKGRRGKRGLVCGWFAQHAGTSHK